MRIIKGLKDMLFLLRIAFIIGLELLKYGFKRVFRHKKSIQKLILNY